MRIILALAGCGEYHYLKLSVTPSFWNSIAHFVDLLLSRVSHSGRAVANALYRTLLTSSAGLENAKELVTAYKTGKVKEMTPDLWKAKKIIDSTIHPGIDGQPHGKSWRLANCHKDTGEAVFLPFRMSCFVLTNLIVTGGMLTPGLGVRILQLTIMTMC